MTNNNPAEPTADEDKIELAPAPLTPLGTLPLLGGSGAGVCGPDSCSI